MSLGRNSLRVGADLYLVDAADEQRVGAGPGVAALGAVGVGCVLVVVVERSSSPTTSPSVRVRTSKRQVLVGHAGRRGPR